MWLKQLSLTAFRNIEMLHLNVCHPQFNLITGANGSGKTSILEAINLLSMGRSFRTLHAAELIQFGAPLLRVRGLLESDTHALKLAIERNLEGELRLRVGDKPAASIADLARELPLQVLNAHSFELLEAGPAHRRQFLDGGAFHVEPSFHLNWQHYRRVLKQRNACLKSRREGMSELNIWDQELVRYGLNLDRARRHFVDVWQPYLQTVLSEMLGLYEVKVVYRPGWDEGQDLLEALQGAHRRDQALGYSSKGPHRAELELTTQGGPIKSILSRGQLKRFVVCMLLARSSLLELEYQRSSVFLLDDLSAELDPAGIRQVLSKLTSLGCQAFLTSIDAASLQSYFSPEQCVVFELEAGQLYKVH